MLAARVEELAGGVAEGVTKVREELRERMDTVLQRIRDRVEVRGHAKCINTGMAQEQQAKQHSILAERNVTYMPCLPCLHCAGVHVLG